MIESQLWLGDCLELMKAIPDGSVDMVLADLPYNKQQGRWDNIIPFEPLWDQLERVIKDRGGLYLLEISHSLVN